MTSEKKGEGDAGIASLEMLHEPVNVLQERINYPEVRRDESITDDYYGIKVSDPYRFLEDPDSEETRAFIQAQNKLTDEYLRNSMREEIAKKIVEISNYVKSGVPRRLGSRYYTWINYMRNHDVSYVQDTLDGESRVFFDPNTLSTDGSVSLACMTFSEDGSLVALAFNNKGSDWATIKFRNVSSGQDFPETLVDVKFSDIEWSKDGVGIFYARYPKEGRSRSEGTETSKYGNHKLYYHRAGTDQAEDVLVVEFEDSQLIIGDFDVSDDGKYLIIFPKKGASGAIMVYFASLEEEMRSGGIRTKLQVTPIVDKPENEYYYVTSEGSVIYVMTNRGAPNYKIIKFDLNQPDPLNWTTVVPEKADNLQSCGIVDNDKLLLMYLVDVKPVVEMWSLSTDTFIQPISMPFDFGWIDSFSGRKKDSEFFFRVVSFLNPGTIYRVDLKNSPIKAEVFREMKVPGYDPEKFEEKQVFYESKDGTRVPMFLVHKKDLELNGDASTLLYGYGGHGYSSFPTFRTNRIVFLQNFNGVLAVPNIRGGGEYGTKWHEGGRLLNKQNCIDDFHAAADYLIREKYTSACKLAINGGSNGGLLVGACVNQRPELYKAAIAEVGTFDLLRFQKFTIGDASCSEYGCSESGDKTVFDNLYRLSPLHNVKLPVNEQVQYPSVLLTTADHDDRVVPLHSYKMIAELQYKIGRAPRQTNPLLIRIETSAGHGPGKPASKILAELAEFYAFLVESAGFVFTP